MDYYKKLNLKNYLGHDVIIGLNDGTFREGVYDLELINEDYEEDNERAALGILSSGRLEGIYLDIIRFITKSSDVSCIKEAV